MDVLFVFADVVDRLGPDIAAFLDNFRDDRVPLRLSLAIATVALVLLAMLVVWGAAAWWRIDRLRRRVRFSGTRADFGVKFDSLDAALSRSIFGAAWHEYRACLKKDGSTVVYFRRPDEYLGLHAIGSAGFPVRLFAAAHGYFIGVGLLLTFIGLVAALKFAAAGVASADVAVAKQALNALLSAASFKFMTSIAGLGCSLMLSIAARSVTYAVETAAGTLARELESRMVPVFAEAVAYEQLAATREQLGQLKKIGSSMGLPVADAVAPRIEASLSAALAPVTEVIAALPSALSAAIRHATEEHRTDHHQAVQQMMRDFASETRSATSTEIKQLASKLADIGNAIGQTQQHIDKSGQTFADKMSLAASELLSAARTLGHGVDGRVNAMSDSIDALQKTLAKSDAVLASAATDAAQGMARTVKAAGDEIALLAVDAARKLEATSDSLAHRIGGMIGALDGFNHGVVSQADAMREIVGCLNGVQKALDESAGTWARTSAPVVAAVDASKRVAFELARVVDRVAAAQHDMADMASGMTKASEKAVAVWDNYRGRFEKVDEDLKAVFLRLEDGTRSFGKEVMEFVGKLDANLAAGTQALSIGTEELREVAETLLANTALKAA